LDVIQPILVEENNRMLMELISIKDLKVVVFGLARDKSPRLDGF
jgi:hypothetical protein